MPNTKKIMLLLVDVEMELRQLSLWEQEVPSEQALASTQPFCIDCLRFNQWLQFIFLPRVRSLIHRRQPLPSRCGIAPMAEQSLAGLTQNGEGLLAMLVDLDGLLNQSFAQ